MEHALIFVICHIRVRCFDDQARGFHIALRKHLLLHQKLNLHTQAQVSRVNA